MSRIVRERPDLVPQLVQHQSGDAASQSRVNDQVAQLLTKTARERSVVIFNLVVGNNRLNHGLTGRPLGANVCPTVADASFAWSFEADGDKQAIITVVGIDQPNAPVEFYR